ncbi:hypothetical protein ACLOJK_022546 [Asimina triloba]
MIFGAPPEHPYGTPSPSPRPAVMAAAMAAEPITAGDSSFCPTSPPPPIPADNGDHEQTPVRLRLPFPPSSRSSSPVEQFRAAANISSKGVPNSIRPRLILIQSNSHPAPGHHQHLCQQ